MKKNRENKRRKKRDNGGFESEAVVWKFGTGSERYEEKESEICGTGKKKWNSGS